MKRTAAQVWQRGFGGLLASVAVAALLGGCGSGSSTPPLAKSSSTSRKLSVTRKYIQTARWMMSRGKR